MHAAVDLSSEQNLPENASNPVCHCVVAGELPNRVR